MGCFGILSITSSFFDIITIVIIKLATSAFSLSI
jgi:hypothetical protein